jgi:DNA repair protein RadC
MKELLKQILREESVEYITEHYPSFRLLANASERELKQIPFVGEVKARELKTIFDISKSLLQPETELQIIKAPQDVYDLMKIMALYEEERVCCILLDTKNKVIDQVLISKGSLNSSIIHPREVFTPAIRNKASAIILVHNHPSQENQESREDIEVTKRIKDAGEIIGIKLLDHIIVVNTGYTSLKEKGVI